MVRFDLALVGGGLQNCLIALATLARTRARIALVESAPRLGGNHTWCFHARDVPADDAPVVRPLVTHRWSRHEVRFPGLRRVIDGEYSAVTSARLADILVKQFSARSDCRLLCGVGARIVEPRRVILGEESVIEATTVIDARGPKEPIRDCGYQKFCGLEIETSSPHDVAWPLLMDATVEQRDGLHFFYLLPFGPRRLLVEETWFSRSPTLDRSASERSIARYAQAQGWTIDSVVRHEDGVLPMPWKGMPMRPRSSPLIAGYAGGWFNPATGYSFPVAWRLAKHVASRAPGPPFGDDLDRLFDKHASQVRYMHALNRLLFRGLQPEQAWRVFERFYRMPQDLIERFYLLELSPLDRARILIGRPPRGFSMWRLLRRERGEAA